jgi:hypothetical protein
MAKPEVDFAALLGCLGDVEYPATKEDLVEAARARGAGEAEARWLDSLPERPYESSADVMGEAGAEDDGGEEDEEETNGNEADPAA